MKLRLLFALCVILSTFSSLPMDRPEQEEGQFASLPTEMQEKIIFGLIAVADPREILLTDLIKNNRRVISRITELDASPDGDILASKKYIRKVWRDVWSALNTNSSMKSLVQDQKFKKKLFLTFVHRLFDDNLGAIDLYNDEIVAIARTLGFKLDNSWGTDLQAVPLLVSLGMDPDGKYSEILAQALTVFNDLYNSIEHYQEQKRQQGISQDAKVTETIIHQLETHLVHYQKLIAFLVNQGAQVPRGYEDEYKVYKTYNK